MKVKRRDLKREGKKTLKSQAADLILVRTLVTVCVSIVSLLSGTILKLVVGGPAQYGVYKTFYKASQGEKIEPKEALAGFKERFGTSFLAGLIVELIAMVPKLLFSTIAFALILSLLSASSVFSFIDFGFSTSTFVVSSSTIVAIIICDIICFVFLYVFSMTQYLLMRDEKLKAFQALKMSGSMMKGEKFRLLIFDLSFILWIIATVATSGLVGIWTLPYYTSSKIEFFSEVYARKIDIVEEYNYIFEKENKNVIIPKPNKYDGGNYYENK